MDDSEDILNATDKHKRSDFNSLSIKPSLSEMFLEATNQLKDTEMTPDKIRNYTLKRYNVDVIKCMKDINLLTRFSEIKVPTMPGANRRSIKSAKKQQKNPKTVRRITANKTRKPNLIRKGKTKPVKRTTTKREPQTPNFTFDDLQSDTLNAGSVHKNLQSESVNFVNKDPKESDMNTGLISSDLPVDRPKEDSKNKPSVEFSPSICHDKPSVEKRKNLSHPREEGKKAGDKLEVNKGRNIREAKGGEKFEKGRKKPRPKMKSGKTKTVKIHGTSHPQNRYKTERSPRLRAFEKEGNSAKKITKQSKRSYSGTPASSIISKKNKTYSKRIDAKVRFAEDYEESCKFGKKSHVSKKSSTDTRIEWLRELVKRRNLKKPVK